LNILFMGKINILSNIIKVIKKNIHVFHINSILSNSILSKSILIDAIPNTYIIGFKNELRSSK